MLPSTIFKDWNMSTTQNDVKAINGWWCIFCLDLCVNVYTLTMYIYINFDVWPQNAVNVKSDILGNKPNSYCYMWRVSSKRRTALIHKTGHEWTSHQLQPANPTSTQCTRAKTIHNFQLPKLSPTPSRTAQHILNVIVLFVYIGLCLYLEVVVFSLIFIRATPTPQQHKQHNQNPHKLNSWWSICCLKNRHDIFNHLRHTLLYTVVIQIAKTAS